MSKVEVNTVEPQCGTTLTLGGSGDTVALGSGASQTGFGRTGTVDWITTPKVTGDSPVTGVTGKGYFLNTTAGVITLNLPAGAAGSIVSLADYAGTWQTNNVTVSPNGAEKIGAIAQDATLNTEGQSVTFVYVDSTQGWVNTMDSTSNVRGAIPFIVATGGTPCSGAICGNCKVHTFTGPGTFTVCTAATGPNVPRNEVSYMVIAGGGSGGSAQYNAAGGGGAGGYRETKSPNTPYTASPLDGYATPGNRITVTATGYPIVVGGGGPSVTGNGTDGNDGSNSSFSTSTSTGGGGGTAGNAAPPANPGGSGGGAGGGGRCITGGSGNTPSTTPAQGFNGGNGAPPPSPDHGAGGGGGATAVGAPAAAASGVGGDGATTSINATPTARAGGGGGSGNPTGSVPQGAGGTGGGGAGGPGGGNDGVAGTINTGSGGGGASGEGAPGGNDNSGQGGSGVVIIRYKFQ